MNSPIGEMLNESNPSVASAVIKIMFGAINKPPPTVPLEIVEDNSGPGYNQQEKTPKPRGKSKSLLVESLLLWEFFTVEIIGDTKESKSS